MTSPLHTILGAMGVMRMLIGLAPFVAAGAGTKLFGFPASHDTPTTRLMARVFGVRDFGLGVLMFWSLANPGTLSFILLFQALTDFGDACSAAIPLVRRQGIDRGAALSMGIALMAGIGWLVARSFVAPS